LIFFSLSLLSISETNAGTEKIWNQFVHHIHSGKDYNQMYEDMVNRLKDTSRTMTGSEKKDQLLDQIGKQLHNILSNIITGTNNDDFTRNIKSVTQKSTDRIGDAISKLMNLVPKSMKDQLNAIELSTKLDVVFAFGETGFMIHSLLETWDEVKKSEQYRRSPELQQETTKIKEILAKAEKLYRTADVQIDRIYTISNIDEQQIALRKIALDLERANLICQQAQQVFSNTLSNIHEKMKKLSSAKANHSMGFITSLIRLIYTVIDYILNSVSGLTKPFKLLIACLHTSNTIGHTAGFYWTRSEIQELEKYQVILSQSQNKINQLIDDINYGLKTLENLKQHI
jgi:hypothetical protein